MKCKKYRFDEVTVNFDRKRIPLSSKQRAERQGCYRYYGAQGVIDYIDDYIFDGTYLLIAEDGENLKSQKQNIAQIVKGKFWVNNHAHIIQTNELCDLRYLYYLINRMDLSGYITGSAQPKLSQANLNAVVLELPTIEEQKRIVSILGTLDDKITLNNKINENLEQQAQALFKAWFVDFIPFGRSVPKNWKNLSFSEFLTVSTEKSDDQELMLFSVTDTGIYPRNKKFKKNLSMQHAKNKVVRQTDLVFGMSRQILNWGVMKYLIGAVSSAYNVYRVDSHINSLYLESYIKSHIAYFKDLIKPASREGQGIDKNALMQKKLLLPPDDILNKYYDMENVFITLIENIRKENQCLEVIRDILLPKLMNDGINITNVDF